MRPRGLLVVVLLALAACGGKEAGRDAPASPGSAPPGSRAPLTKPELIKLSSRTLAGFSGSVSRLDDAHLTMRFTTDERTPGGVKLIVEATIQHCDPRACASVDPTRPGNREALAKARAGLEEQAYTDAVVEQGAFELAPAHVGLAQFRRAHKQYVQADGTVVRSSSHVLDVRFHDGTHAIRLRVRKQGTSNAETAAELERAMPRERAEDAARRVFALYADLFGRGLR